MNRPCLLLADADRAALAAAVLERWGAGQIVALATHQEAAVLRAALPAALEAPWGPAVVLGTGGSSGGRRWCVQPLSHLQVAIDATAGWLRGLGLVPQQLELFNPLPLQHVSGLMPLLRARAWGAELRWLAPALMRRPAQLLAQASPTAPDRAVLSLVPTQLQRLVDEPAGIRWLERFALIWVGGAALPAALAQRCRQLGLALAPCYGSTETGAMVAALAPEQFLQGVPGCGQPLPHARLRRDACSGAIQIKADSLALGFLHQGLLEPLPQRQGWWRSGDRGELTGDGLVILGRLDGALQSGGETVFPEQVEQRLLELASAQAFTRTELLLLPEPDPLWGERLVALLKPAAWLGSEGDRSALVQRWEDLARALPPSQRPRRWLLCPDLERNGLGKWERQRWKDWLLSQPAAAP
jgi:o-succinylbenzoate---CoA ligase